MNNEEETNPEEEVVEVQEEFFDFGGVASGDLGVATMDLDIGLDIGI